MCAHTCAPDDLQTNKKTTIQTATKKNTHTDNDYIRFANTPHNDHQHQHQQHHHQSSSSTIVATARRMRKRMRARKCHAAASLRICSLLAERILFSRFPTQPTQTPFSHSCVHHRRERQLSGARCIFQNVIKIVTHARHGTELSRNA